MNLQRIQPLHYQKCNETRTYIIIATGRPGSMYPMINSVITLSTHHGQQRRRQTGGSRALEPDLAVRHRLDHADGHDVHERDEQRDDERPDGHARRPGLDARARERERHHWRHTHAHTRTQSAAIPRECAARAGRTEDAAVPAEKGA